MYELKCGLKNLKYIKCFQIDRFLKEKKIYYINIKIETINYNGIRSTVI